MESNIVESSFASSFNTCAHTHTQGKCFNDELFRLSFERDKKIIKGASKNHSSYWQVEQTYKGLLSPAHHLRLYCLPPLNPDQAPLLHSVSTALLWRKN